MSTGVFILALAQVWPSWAGLRLAGWLAGWPAVLASTWLRALAQLTSAPAGLQVHRLFSGADRLSRALTLAAER